MSATDAVLFLTHTLSDRSVRKEYQRIRRAAPDLNDTFVLFDCTDREPRHCSPDEVYGFTADGLRQLGYPMLGDRMIPGHGHFPLEMFFRDHGEYEHYWLIEYDVRFNGDWGRFFRFWQTRDCDLVACRVQPYANEPRWPWWKLTHPHDEIPLEQRMRMFTPIYRISAPALQHLHERMLDGWCGHYEVLMPSLLHFHGYKMEDLANPYRTQNGEAGTPFYTTHPPNEIGEIREGTMRFRPLRYTMGWQRNMLYHPIKGVVPTFRHHLKRSYARLKARVQRTPK